MTLERITQDNIDYATQIQAELFPGESGRTNFEESLIENSLLIFGSSLLGKIGEPYQLTRPLTEFFLKNKLGIPS